MPGSDRIQHVGFQHGVFGNALQGNAVVGQYVLVVLQVLADLGQTGVLQQRLELIQHFVTIQLLGSAHIIVPQGDIGGLAGFDGERHTDDLGIHVPEAGGFSIEGKQLGRFQAFQPLIQFLLVGDDAVVFPAGLRAGFCIAGPGGAGGWGFALFQFGNPGAELVFLEQLKQLPVILFPKLQVFQAKIQFHVGADGRQFTAQGQGLRCVPQVFTDLAFDIVGVFDDVVQVVVALKPFDRGLRSALVDAGDVVHLIAHQGQVIDNLLRSNAEFLHHAVPVHPGLGHGVNQRNVIADQLRHVLVAGGDHHIDAFAGCFVGEGADHVVGLNACHS